MMRLAGLAFRRRSRLNSNVSPQQMLTRSQGLLALATLPKPLRTKLCSRELEAEQPKTFREHPRRLALLWHRMNNATRSSATREEDRRAENTAALPAAVRPAVRKRARGEHEYEDKVPTSPLEQVRVRPRKQRTGTPPSVAPRELRANPSFEARPNGIALGPRGALVHHPPRGPSAMPSVPTQLER
jgi:hypothetical protein